MWKEEEVVWPWPWAQTPQGVRNGDLPPQALPLAAKLQTHHVHSQEQSPLFRLSPEIREYIYRMVLQTECHPAKPYPPGAHIFRPSLTGRLHADTALLRTCWSIYLEAWALPSMLTTLIIHQGSAHDRPRYTKRKRFGRPGEHERLHLRPGKRFFHLQAWQLLLVQRVEMRFQQISLEGGGMENWIRHINGARQQANETVQHLALTDADAGLKEFVDRNLSTTGIRELVVRMNRCDWWTWTFDPRNAKADLAEAAAHSQALRLEKPPSPLSVVGHEANALPLFSHDFAFKLELETFAQKAAQLGRIIDLAKHWEFQPGDNSTHQQPLLWDGQVGVESWTSCNSECRWQVDNTRVEERTIKFVPGGTGGRRMTN
ncbi:hypothetical protein B0I35DRAFT_441105 [Stachybotrys elegans]|uniref:Uncharacterized protein n=1 Tax=Stachybotrys elegans TaxID=80388 RepID=A0A8K0SLL3_9HYPO|nr:hypothetical protein B0I35DRAFT_441105 [Stachybotrys elegans]